MKTEMPFSRPGGFQYNISQESNYIADLRGYQRDRKNSTFLNDSVGHATLLADMMIGAADKYAIIYSGSLYKKVYEFALSHLPDSVKVRVLLDEPLAGIDHWWELLHGKNLVVYQTKKKLTLRDSTLNHYFVCDGVAVRYELSDEKTTAIANFNMPDACTGLIRSFSDAWGASTGSPLDVVTA